MLVVSMALAGCANLHKKPEETGKCPPQPLEADPRLGVAQQEIADLKNHITSLESEISVQARQSQELQLQLAEQHSRNQQLQHLREQAVQEVVRAKARLRSRHSRAETVANLAELKLELKNAESKKLDNRQQNLVRRARHYLNVSETALEENNYEGSSYLMGQARQYLVQMKSPGSDKITSDSSFPVPVTMKTRKLCNVRKEASLKSKVLFQLTPGSEVSAIDRKGLWVKIKTPENQTGWAHFSLLNVRY